MIAFLINVSVISVSGAVCNSPNISAEDQKSCQDLDLNKASFLLKVCSSAKFASTFKHFLLGFWSVMWFHNLDVLPWWFASIFAECFGELEFKTFCNCFASIRSELYNYRDICRPICYAGTVPDLCCYFPLFQIK